jgi:hypothetical protein
VGGKFLSTYMSSSGRPTRDRTNERGRQLIAQLTAADFGSTGARFGPDGSIRRPA